jgi:demethylmenaquinone methyltransferase/2-methoxy-6-polyprenyl-1,4-benzoquinol methylase
VSLRQRISTADGKQQYVRRLFATIADRYDFITRFLSYGQDARWKRRLIRLAALQPGDAVLDLACGTGDLAFAAAPHVRRAVGLDVTFRMVQLARRKNEAWPDFSGGAGKNSGQASLSFVTGDMLALPFPDGSFDVVTTGYGLRNVPDLDRALAEIARVLRPDGRLLSLDFNRPSNALVRAVYLAYLTVVGGVLGYGLHGDPDTYRYIPASIRLYPGAHAVAMMMQAHGFHSTRVIPVLGGLMALHVARRGR